jgi:NADPH:quinone reductase-like Zn-dependent oxidoreductase
MNANTTKRLEMKAIVFNQYGTPDVLKLANVPAPTPKDDQVLIRVFAASVNSADYRLLSGPIPRLMGFGLCRPNNKIMGADIAGRIEAVGKNVSRFKPGDEVFADISTGFGGFAEYVCTRESVLVEKPANLTFEQAAAVPMAAVTALQGLRASSLETEWQLSARLEAWGRLWCRLPNPLVRKSQQYPARKKWKASVLWAQTMSLTTLAKISPAVVSVTI